MGIFVYIYKTETDSKYLCYAFDKDYDYSNEIVSPDGNSINIGQVILSLIYRYPMQKSVFEAHFQEGSFKIFKHCIENNDSYYYVCPKEN